MGSPHPEAGEWTGSEAAHHLRVVQENLEPKCQELVGAAPQVYRHEEVKHCVEYYSGALVNLCLGCGLNINNVINVVMHKYK